MKPVVITIAGFDPTGGAGVAADCRTLALHEVEPVAVITANTVQDSQKVYGVAPTNPGLLREQLTQLFKDIPVVAAKTGLLPNPEVIAAVAELLPEGLPLIVDPVLKSSSEFTFLDEIGQEALKKVLLPRAMLVTPNQQEITALTQVSIHDPADMETAAKSLMQTGVEAVLVTGGEGPDQDAVDRLFDAEGSQEYRAPRVEVEVHGTGCALSAAIAAEVAKGNFLRDAIQVAKEFVHTKIGGAVRRGRGRSFLDL